MVAGINRAAMSMGCSNYGSIVPTVSTNGPQKLLGKMGAHGEAAAPGLSVPKRRSFSGANARWRYALASGDRVTVFTFVTHQRTRAALSCCGTLSCDRCILRSHHSREHLQAARPRPRKAVNQP